MAALLIVQKRMFQRHMIPLEMFRLHQKKDIFLMEKFVVIEMDLFSFAGVQLQAIHREQKIVHNID